MVKGFVKLADQIKDKINQAERILLSLHRGPDGDSIGANLAMKQFLEQKGKKVKLISPSPVPKTFDYLSVDQIDHLAFTRLKLDGYDLFILLDSASWQMVDEDIDSQTGLPDKEKVVVIDHHITNEQMGEINLVDTKAASTTEILFNFFEHWRFELDKKLALLLLVGIVTDTGVFRYTNTTIHTFNTAAELMSLGADLDIVVFNHLRRNNPNKLKFWGIVLENLIVDEGYKFAYSFIPYQKAKNYLKDTSPRGYKSGAAGLFMAGIEGTKFGIVMVEEKPNEQSGSLRSRRDFDVSQIAAELGGGGHSSAAGFSLQMPFDKAEEKVLEVAKSYSQEFTKLPRASK